MILHSYRHKGTVAFPDEIKVDFDQLPPLIGVHGRNGAGKTTFLDTIVAAFYLQMPFRPDPLHAAFATRGYIDLVWSLEPGAPRYRSRVNVDPAANKTEAVLYPAEGGNAIAGPLQRAYLVKIKELLGPLDLFLSTSYTTQPSYTTGKNAFSFLLADRADRRAIMSEMLGLGAYVMRHAVSRDKIRAVESRVALLKATREQLEVEVVKRAEVQKRADDAEARLTAAKESLSVAQKAHGEAQEALRTLEKARAVYEPLRAQRDVLAAELKALLNRQKKADEALISASAALKEAEEFAAAPANKDAIDAELATLAGVEIELAGVSREILELEIEISGLTEDKKRYAVVLAQADMITMAATRDQVLDGHISRLRQEVDASVDADAKADRAYADWQLAKKTVLEEKRRARSLEQAIALIDRVPCKGEERFSGCQFLVDAAKAKDELPAVADAVASMEEQLGPDRTPPVSSTAALRNQLDGYLQEREGLKRLLDLQSGLEAARTHADAIDDQVDRLNTRLTDKRSLRGVLEDKVLPLKELRELAAKLVPAVALARSIDVRRATAAASSAAVTQLHDEAAAKTTQLQETEDKLSGIEVTDQQILAANATLSKKASEVRAMQTVVITVERETAGLATRLQVIDEAARRLDKMKADAVVVAGELDNWNLMALAMSPAGIPALLIDQALPEIGRLATDMLQECLGENLFSIQLTTQRASADDKKMLEVLDVVVFREGQKVAVEHLSGGEGVLVSEALSLAIALYNANLEGGKRHYTFFRDEVGANLDVVRAPAYARLLARALKLGGYDKGFFVSHHPAALAVADACIEVRDGSISVS